MNEVIEYYYCSSMHHIPHFCYCTYGSRPEQTKEQLETFAKLNGYQQVDEGEERLFLAEEQLETM